MPTTIDPTVHRDDEDTALQPHRGAARARQTLVAIGAVTATAAVLAVASSIVGHWG